jgi:putative hydroxymethylpyrimidine transport system substrate-binding protein
MVAGLLAAVLLVGCGSEQASETVRQQSKPAGVAQAREDERACFDGQRRVRSMLLSLAGRRGPESVGILMAEKQGYFTDAGLTVSILSPETPNRPVKYLLEGMDDMGVVPQPQVALAIENGKPIVAVGSVVPDPTETMIWLKGSGIDRLSDLKGKTIAIPGLPFQRAFLESVLARAGLTPDDIKVRGVRYDLVEELARGRVDAIFGGSRQVEGRALKLHGLDPDVVPARALGLPPYEEMTFIVRTDCAAAHPQVIRHFLGAVRRGVAAASAEPERAARIISGSFEGNPELSPAGMEAAVRATLPDLSRNGRMSLARAQRLAGWMHKEGLLANGSAPGQPPAADWVTNEYVR